MDSEFLQLVYAGESETLELKETVRDPRILSRVIGSFANAAGGKLIVGVREPPEVVGVDVELTRRVYEAARSLLTPEPRTTLSFIAAEGKSIAVIDVQRSSELVLADGRILVRAGTLSQPMASGQMRHRLPAHPNEATVESLIRAIEERSKLIEEMHEQVKEADTWQARWKERSIGFTLGALASVIASIAYARL